MVKALNTTSAAAQEREDYQPELDDDSPFAEDSNYLSNQLITYIGNKRALLGANWQSGYVCQETDRQGTSPRVRRI